MKLDRRINEGWSTAHGLRWRERETGIEKERKREKKTSGREVEEGMNKKMRNEMKSDHEQRCRCMQYV